jgi:hypothetical protein
MKHCRDSETCSKEMEEKNDKREMRKEKLIMISLYDNVCKSFVVCQELKCSLRHAFTNAHNSINQSAVQ